MTDTDKSLLIVDDNARFAEALSGEFRDRGYEVTWAASITEVKALDGPPPAFAVVDLRLGADSGLDVVPLLRERSDETKIVILTGYGSIATAVKATKLGAVSYLMKPADVDQIERALMEEEDEEDITIPDEFQSLYRHEREYIEFVLAECDGNISQAARRLGLHRQSLQRKLRKYTPQ